MSWLTNVLGMNPSDQEASQQVAAPAAVPFMDLVFAEVSIITSTATLPMLDPADFAYRPMGGEKLIAVKSNVSRFEMKSTGRYLRSGFNVSVPIWRGFSYRTGTAKIKAEKAMQVTGIGQLLVTSKALVFESPQKNERLTWAQIADVDLHTDGCTVTKRTGPPRCYVFGHEDPKFAAILFAFTHGLECS